MYLARRLRLDATQPMDLNPQTWPRPRRTTGTCTCAQLALYRSIDGAAQTAMSNLVDTLAGSVLAIRRCMARNSLDFGECSAGAGRKLPLPDCQRL